MEENTTRRNIDLSTSKIDTIKKGNIISGTVALITPSHVVVDAGIKSEAFIPRQQFRSEEASLAVGKEVKTYVMSLDDGRGNTILSREKAISHEAINTLQSKLQNGELVVGKIIKQVRGGYTVIVENIRAFLPGSLAGYEHPSSLLDSSVSLKVMRVDEVRCNVVVSRKNAIEDINSSKKYKLMENLAVGDIVEGVIKNITSFGAFIDLGGVDGLIHIADISWVRINHPSEVLSTGDVIKVKVLNIKDNKLFLGLKQVTEDPWLAIDRTLQIGQVLQGTVTNVTEYGCFVALDNGIEGLVHSSEMDWRFKTVNPKKIFKPGDQVAVKVISIDLSKRRIALSTKSCDENPWEKFSSTQKPGDILEGSVISITEFGVFVRLANNIDGLIHVSDLAEGNKHQHKKGDKIVVSLIGVNTEKQRISLREHDPVLIDFDNFSSKHEVGSQIKGAIKDIDEQGNFHLSLEENIAGFMPKDRIAKQYSDAAPGHMVAGEIIRYDKSAKRVIIASASSTSSKQESGPQIHKVTLGDLIREKMEQDS